MWISTCVCVFVCVFFYICVSVLDVCALVCVKHSSQKPTLRGDGRWGKKEKNKKSFPFFLVPNPRPGPDGPRASGWYGRLREPISPLSLLNSHQLWQLFSRRWTILLSTVINDLDHGITAKYSKRQTSFYSMQVSFHFHSLRCSEILVSPSICTKIRTRRFHRTEEVSNKFSVSWHITHISMAISANLGRDTDHNSTKLVCDHPLHTHLHHQKQKPPWRPKPSWFKLLTDAHTCTHTTCSNTCIDVNL